MTLSEALSELRRWRQWRDFPGHWDFDDLGNLIYFAENGKQYSPVTALWHLQWGHLGGYFEPQRSGLVGRLIGLSQDETRLLDMAAGTFCLSQEAFQLREELCKIFGLKIPEFFVGDVSDLTTEIVGQVTRRDRDRERLEVRLGKADFCFDWSVPPTDLPSSLPPDLSLEFHGLARVQWIIPQERILKVLEILSGSIRPILRTVWMLDLETGHKFRVIKISTETLEIIELSGDRRQINRRMLEYDLLAGRLRQLAGGET